MISKWKVAAIIITTVAKMAIVSPAFAQSFDPEVGTGNVLMLNNQATVPHKQAAVRRSGIDAFAMVPRAQAGVASEDPANTGGGSIGYNETFEMTETWRKQGGWNSALFRALQDFGQDCRLEVTQFTSTDHP